MVIVKLSEWLLLAKSCYRAAKKITSYGLFFNPSLKTSSSQQQQSSLFPNVVMCDLENRGSHTLVCDIHGALLTTHSFFPYFMLVAFEGGSIFRALLLLLSCPILCALSLDFELNLRVMIFITFCGLRIKDMEIVGRAVLPKFFMENLHFQACEVLASTGCSVVFTSVPRVMVDGFLREYLRVDNVIGTELHTFGHHFTGLISDSGLLVKHRALKDYFGDKKPDIGLGTSSLHDQLFISLCKEAYVVNKDDSSKSMSTNKSHQKLKPVIFHDGRLAFLPTPLATLAMFAWLPFGVIIAIFRIFIGIFLPYKLALLLGGCSGVKIRVDIRECNPNPIKSSRVGVLYVCSHRTLLDPVFLSTSLGKPLTAVTYSVSKMSELIAPIKTVRLTRERNQDGETMRRLLSEGDLVVCPEGTTCREPYLLRFSSLFAELTENIVPVAVNTRVTMFYGTTASGLKCLDPIFFLMNPRPVYHIQILEKLPTELTCGGGKSSCEVANYIQKQLADALGFQCTSLTRKDKYMMLAGNEGVVVQDIKKNKP